LAEKAGLITRMFLCLTLKKRKGSNEAPPQIDVHHDADCRMLGKIVPCFIQYPEAGVFSGAASERSVSDAF